MKVKVWLMETSQPIEIEDVTNTYQKGDMYCVYQEDLDQVQKFPVDRIFRVIEQYPRNTRANLSKRTLEKSFQEFIDRECGVKGA